jgi:hypothetical protein
MNKIIKEVETFTGPLPILDVGNQVGRTHYIDFIDHDMMSFPLMKGKDCFGRPFLAVKVDVEFKSENKVKSCVGAYFQRYSDSEKTICFGTCYFHDVLYHDSCIRTEHKFVLFRIKAIVLSYFLQKPVFTFSCDFDFNSTNKDEVEVYGNNLDAQILFNHHPRKQLKKLLETTTFDEIVHTTLKYF